MIFIDEISGEITQKKLKTNSPHRTYLVKEFRNKASFYAMKPDPVASSQTVFLKKSLYC
jgi:hypothetical protein